MLRVGGVGDGNLREQMYVSTTLPGCFFPSSGLVKNSNCPLLRKSHTIGELLLIVVGEGDCRQDPCEFLFYMAQGILVMVNHSASLISKSSHK